MKKNKNIFPLLFKNTIRILKNSKILITQLGVLLLIGISVIGTILMSTFLLSESKNLVHKEGNVADFTFTIPQKYIEESLKKDPSNLSSIYSGKTPADIELQEYLYSKNLNFSFSKNLSMNDLVSGNSFILSLANYKNEINNDVVNSLVIEQGSKIPTPVNSELDPDIDKSTKYFLIVRDLNWSPNDQVLVDLSKRLFNYDNYIQNKPWKLAKLLIESNWNLPKDTTNKIVELIKPITIPPSSRQDYMDNYYPFIGEVALGNISYKTNSYFYKLAQKFSINKIGYNGYGYSIIGNQTIPLLGMTSDIPFSISNYDKSSFFTSLSTNFMSANASTKKVLSPRTIQDVLQLPYKVNSDLDDTLNPGLVYKVYNQDTNQYEVQRDFITWLANLDDKYKISINSLQYVITASGNQPNILYPVQSTSQLLVDSKNNGVAYVNNLGFSRAVDATSYNQTVYYSIKYPEGLNLFEKTQLLKEVNDWAKQKYYSENTLLKDKANVAFNLSDSTQPNRLFYIWSSFLNNVQYIITSIGATIGSIVVFLALIFISLLIRSILKINKTTFAIGLANGVSKLKLILSFLPFAIIPSLLFGTAAFFIAYALIQPTIYSLENYWTLSISNLPLYWWIWLVIVVFTTLLLYLIIVIVILFTFKKNVSTLFSDTSTFKLNSLIIYTRKLTDRFSALWSFRITFMMNNVSRFIILLFSVVYIISLSSVIVGTYGAFQNALAANAKNKKYVAAYDLYSPTINSGYYSDISYDMLGTSQKGIFNSYDVTTPNYNSPMNSNSEFYKGPKYNNALAYPYASNLWFTSLFMVSSSIANEINWNLKFMNNRLFSKLLLDVEVNALGANLNPWEFAREIIPEPVQHLAESNGQLLAQTNFDFYLWLQEQNRIAINNETDKFINIDSIKPGDPYSQFNNKPITYKDYLPNIVGQPFTLDNSDLVPDYLDATNKNQWILIKRLDTNSNKYVWELNKDFAVNGAPSFTMKPETSQLFVQLLTNNNNPLFQFWYTYCYDKNPNLGNPNVELPNYNYKIGSAMVPVDNTDETYTYLSSIIHYPKKKISVDSKIIGIKNNSNLINLYDEYNNDIKGRLSKYQLEKYEHTDENNNIVVDKIYPLIINNIVEKKYGLKIGDVLKVETSNTFDRFNINNLDQNSNVTNYFKIIGITTTNYEEQYYTLQNYANEILGFQDFSKVSNTNWLSSLQPSKNYVPFNGVFSKDTSLKMIKNFAGLYSPSGLSTILGDLGDESGTTNMGAVGQLIYNNRSNLDNLMNLDHFVDRANNNNIVIKELPNDKKISFTSNIIQPYTRQAIDKITKIFKSNSALVAQIKNVDLSMIATQVGSSFDNVLSKMQIIILNVMLPTIFIIILLLAVIIIFEAKRLIALLKILGYGDISNLFSFLFIYIAVLVLGTLTSIPIAFAALQIIKAVIFVSFNIITWPVLPIWPFFVGFAGVGGMFAILFCFMYYRIKKLSLSEEISGR